MLIQILKKLIICTLIVFTYFFVIRELRVITTAQVGKQIKPIVSEQQALKQSVKASRIWIYYTVDEYQKISTFKIPFGYYFLLATIGFVLLNSKRRRFLELIVIHLTAGILSYIFLMLAVWVSHYFLIVTDLICSYMLPLLSLGLVALSIVLDRKKKLRFETSS